MNVNKFVSSIYLGDRLLNGISLDLVHNELRLKIDLISRIRSNDGNWNFYNDEDIKNGEIVLMNVSSLRFSPDSILPNDQINYFSVTKNGEQDFFTMSVDSISGNDKNEEVLIEIKADKVALYNPYKDELITN